MTPTTASIEPQDPVDVLIVGGGLAGLTLALQLRSQHPALRIRVLERRAHPAPEAAFKIGESTVEVAGHYLANVLGLREHLDREQIVKFGFRFFFSEGRSDFDRCVELGTSRALPTGSWQIDRGRFENFLGQRALEQGIDFRTQATVRKIELLNEHSEISAAEGEHSTHRVSWDQDGSRLRCSARWVIDAAGRAGVLKKQLGLQQDNDHHAHAIWFRVAERLTPDLWSNDPQWRQRCSPADRWRSTNHLVGDGYWAWMIPLSSGSHSVGIVFDDASHPLSSMNTFDRAMDWLGEHQPKLAETLEPLRDKIQDFAFFRNFSYGCKQVFSPQRWAMTGEAGLFLDPFYSPGSDFIAIANTYIASLIAKDLAGEEWQPYVGVYEQLYFSFYESTLAMYQKQYPLFGDPQVLPLKILWDYSYYWGVLAALFFAGRIADLSMIARLKPELAEAKALNLEAQALLRRWGELNRLAGKKVDDGGFLDQASIDWFAALNGGLQDKLDKVAFRERIRSNVARLRALKVELQQAAGAIYPELAGTASGISTEIEASEPLLSKKWLAA